MSDDYKYYNFRVFRKIEASIEIGACGLTPEDAESGAVENASAYLYEEDWDVNIVDEQVVFLGIEPEHEPEPKVTAEDVMKRFQHNIDPDKAKLGTAYIMAQYIADLENDELNDE